MFLKLMGNENKGDDCLNKAYRMVHILSCEFIASEPELSGTGGIISPELSAKWIARCVMMDKTIVQYAVLGNAYILNDEGNTVDSFWPV